MSLIGTFRTMSPAELLQWISIGRKSGKLVVRHDEGNWFFYFDNGTLSYVEPLSGHNVLADVLVRHGFISREERDKALEVQAETSISVPKILLTIQAIAEPDLLDVMRQRAEEEMCEIFFCNNASFEFAPDEVPEMDILPLRMDLTRVILEGSRLVDERLRSREIPG